MHEDTYKLIARNSTLAQPAGALYCRLRVQGHSVESATVQVATRLQLSMAFARALIARGVELTN